MRQGFGVRGPRRLFRPRVVDLSFISLTAVASALAGLTCTGGDLILLVKPQFEVGPEGLGSGGVVRDPSLRDETVVAAELSLEEVPPGLRGRIESPIKGGDGDVEYLVWAVEGASPTSEATS